MITITSVTQIDNDKLKITASVDTSPNPVITHGWLSAIANYYPPDQYDASGHLNKGAVSRQMTTDEQNTYFINLVQAKIDSENTPLYQNGQPASDLTTIIDSAVVPPPPPPPPPAPAPIPAPAPAAPTPIIQPVTVPSFTIQKGTPTSDATFAVDLPVTYTASGLSPVTLTIHIDNPGTITQTDLDTRIQTVGTDYFTAELQANALISALKTQ